MANGETLERDSWDVTPFASLEQVDDAVLRKSQGQFLDPHITLTPEPGQRSRDTAHLDFSSCDSEYPDFSSQDHDSDCNCDCDCSENESLNGRDPAGKITHEDQQDMRSVMKNLDTGEITFLDDTSTLKSVKRKTKWYNRWLDR